MHILYHGNCPDGFAAAVSAWMVHGKQAFYTAVYHGAAVPELKSRKVVLLDFCYPWMQMQEILQQVDELTIIDHHQGMLSVIDGLRSHEKVKVLFDEKHSGAVLSWMHFHPGREVPKLLSFIEDRDCHFNKIADSKAALMWLDTQPFAFSLWQAFINFSDGTWKKVIDYNAPMVKKFNSMIRKAAQQCIHTTLGGYPAGLCFGTEETASDIAVEMAKHVQGIGMVFVVQSSGLVKASLRTSQDINLAHLAQHLGGGGHPYAAAFPCSPEMVACALAGKDLLFLTNDMQPSKDDSKPQNNHDYCCQGFKGFTLNA